ncbi:MAG: hypothetical protein PW786_11945 [Arachidicoccus sp.]|nr:hypothetical protein [Arachidicoccus sp.]
MEEYLIDSNVILNYFSLNFLEKGMKLVSAIIYDITKISVITQIEARSCICADKMKESILKSFIKEPGGFPHL